MCGSQFKNKEPRKIQHSAHYILVILDISQSKLDKKRNTDGKYRLIIRGEFKNYTNKYYINKFLLHKITIIIIISLKLVQVKHETRTSQTSLNSSPKLHLPFKFMPTSPLSVSGNALFARIL